MTDAEPRYVLVTTRRAMVEQADKAIDAICLANRGKYPRTLRDAYDIAPKQFALLIEALYALGADVDQEMQDLAGLKTIDELLGALTMPELAAPRWASVNQAAAYAKVSYRTMRQWVATGVLPAKRPAPRRIQIDLNDVDAIISKHRGQ